MEIIGRIALFFQAIIVTVSVLVLIYYTVETIILWYYYGKRRTIAELGDIVIRRDYRMVVMIPCMNEDRVIANTLRSLTNSKYEKLEIYAINDASSDNTEAEMRSVDDPRITVFNRVKPNAQIGKGKALNWAYNQIADKYRHIGDEVLIVIIDADTEIPENYFENVNYIFNSNEDFTGLQSKVRVIDLGWDSAQDLEFAEIINTTQTMRSRVGTVAFGGNGQFCKLSTLEGLGEDPWSESLVEDFDLSLRLYLSDVEHVENTQFNDVYIRQTGIVKDPKALVKQRVRWAQGNVQSIKYILKILESDQLRFGQKLEIISTLAKPWFMALEYLIVLYVLIIIANTYILQGLNKTVIFLILTFLLMAVYIAVINFVWSILYNRQKDEEFKLTRTIRDTYYLTKFLLTLTQIYPQAIIRYFSNQNGWDKTERQQKK